MNVTSCFVAAAADAAGIYASKNEFTRQKTAAAVAVIYAAANNKLFNVSATLTWPFYNSLSETIDHIFS